MRQNYAAKIKLNGERCSITIDAVHKNTCGNIMTVHDTKKVASMAQLAERSAVNR